MASEDPREKRVDKENAEDKLFSPDEDDELIFAYDDAEPEEETQDYWKILIVDDDIEVHNVTKLALEDFNYDGKKITFESAYSDKEARKLINKHPDTAVILLDVVMEEEDSGLKVIQYLRDDLNNQMTRIILRTGQPGQAPEEKVIIDYDINDYKTKTELTAQKLFTSVVVALRSFKDLMIIESNKEQLKKLVLAYERFVPAEILSFLGKESIIDVKLGDHVEKEMTILFFDIRDFTALSEKMSPEENFKFVNSYLSRMEPIIGENHGFIDKYIGDAIMALFHTDVDDAVDGAIQMLKTLAEYNQHRANSGYEPIDIGIGLNTGSLMLGTVGGKNRMDGTVISDAVNVASRIESLTKIYGTPLLISEQTYLHLKDASKYVIRVIDRVKVRGKTEYVKVFEVFDGDPSKIINLKKRTREDFERGFTFYHQHNFGEAQKYFEKVVKTNKNDKAAQIYIERCEKLKKYGVAVILDM